MGWAGIKGSSFSFFAFFQQAARSRMSSPRLLYSNQNKPSENSCWNFTLPVPMSHRRHAGGGGGPDPFDNSRAVLIEDEYSPILDLSIPRRAGEPRPGPWHRIMFEAMGGPFRCPEGEQGCQPGGGCESRIGEGLVIMAAEHGYRGPPDARQIRNFLQPFYEEIAEAFVNGSPCRVIMSGGGAPIGGNYGHRHQGGARRHGQTRGHVSERRHGTGGAGHGPSGRHRGGGHRNQRRHGF